MERIKTNDTVSVLTGRDKGKTGKVIEIVPRKGKILVKGIAVVTKHAKPRKQGEIAGIKKMESYIDVTNVMPVCTACKKPCRIGSKKLGDGSVVRICKKCNEQF